MNGGAFGENFPYSNFHDLNMDWIIKIAKDFLDQYTHIQQTIDTGLEELETKANTLEELLQTWYNTHSADIQNRLAEALEDLNNWYTEHQEYLNHYLSTLILAFNDAANRKTAESIASIPADYTDLANNVNNAVVNIKEIYEKFGIENTIPLEYGQTSVVLYGGETGTYNNWYSTDFIPCVPGECFHFGAWGYYNEDYDHETLNICPVSFFNSSKQYIGGISSAILPTYQSLNNRRFDDIVIIPPNAAYFKQSYLSVGGIGNFTTKLILIGTPRIINMLSSLLVWEAITVPADKTDVPLYGGGTATYENWFSTDYINCSNSLKLDIVAWGYSENNINISPISFYDSNKNYLSSISGEEGSKIPNYGQNRLFRGQVYIPSNAKYFKLASYQGVGASVYPISASEYVFLNDEKFINKLNIVCIGDSLTEGDQGANPYASAQNITPYNYPYWMQNYLGCHVTNKGRSGYTTIQAWNNIVQSIDFTDVNTIIIMLGSNGGLTDTINTDCPDGVSYMNYANTNTGCYCKIIEYCMAQTSGTAQILLCTPPHVGTVRGQKRTATIAAAEVIRKIASRYCLPLIDMMTESGFSDYNENVYQPVDGLHFTVNGYKRMGTFIGSRVKANNAIQVTL
ncbi:MAG: SGNH/GDSL hydrolase family protein [Clostridiales bacterium]|nr:SGNH/GDSL hydrolase family protein [Clostridiales bacterium]